MSKLYRFAALTALLMLLLLRVDGNRMATLGRESKAGPIQSGFEPGPSESTGVKGIGVVFVDASQLDDSGTGLSWGAAKKTIQAAIAQATTGQKVWVKAGTYKPTVMVGGATDRHKAFQMKEGVKIYGGFAGTEDPLTFNLDDRELVANLTLLSGDIDNNSLPDNGNVYNLFYHPSSLSPTLTSAAILDGFTLTGGWADGTGRSAGGAIFNEGHSPQISKCIFSGNYAAVSGGAVDNINSNAIFMDCTFNGNSAGNGGGAVTNEAGLSPTFTNCSLLNNTVTGGHGGAVYNTNCSPSFTLCSFASNSASVGGGAVFNLSAATVSLDSCEFQLNTALSGGAFYSQGSTTLVKTCTFQNNSATDASNGSGGAIFLDGGSTMDLTNSLLTNNASTKYGGALYLHTGGTLKITNCTFSHNETVNGGGIFSNTGTTMSIFNSIIYQNMATYWGNEIFDMDANGSSITNSCYKNGYYDIWESLVETNCIHVNPRFVNPLNFDYILYGVSPCIDQGLNSAIQSPNTVLLIDNRGLDRVANSTVDMGCFEYTAAFDPYSTDYFVDDDASGTEDGLSWINAFTTLQAALDAALTGDRIFVAAGTYYPSSYYDINPGFPEDQRLKHFRMKEAVYIYGCMAGTEDPDSFDPDSRNMVTNLSILSGDIQTAGDTTDNCYHVFYHPDGLGLTDEAVLDGFEVKVGRADGIDDYKDGAGMFNRNNSPTLRNIRFTGNHSLDRGGAMFNTGSSPTLFRVHFSQNDALTDGGALFMTEGSSPLIISCGFTQNEATYSGGAIYAKENSNPILANCLIAYNTALYGGGVFNQSSLTITNGTIAYNEAYQGGGLSGEANLNLNNCIIWGNDAVDARQIFIKTGTTTELHFCDYPNETGDFRVDGTKVSYDYLNQYPQFVDPNTGRLMLAGNSPCLDAGTNDYFQDSWTTNDLRGPGFPRKVLKTNPATTGIIDIGAYEYKSGTDYASPVPALTTTAPSSILPESAISGGENIQDYGATILAKGIVYDLTSSPTISDNLGQISATVTPGSENASFTVTMTSLSANTKYYVKAYAATTVGYGYASQTSFYTAAKVPAAPTVDNATSTSMDVTINSNGNPASTEYAIQDSVNGNYVQGDGTRGASEVWNTATGWSTITVTGLTSGLTYKFRVKARNTNLVETSFGPGTTGSTCINPTSAGVIGSDQILCGGASPAAITGTAPSGHGGTLEYKWQSSTTSSTTGFTDISPTVITASYTPPTPGQNTWYRRMARVSCKTNWVGAAISNAVKITLSGDGAPPSPWLVGNTLNNANGTAIYSPCEQGTPIRLTESGSSTATVDANEFVYQNLTGNGTVIAYVNTITNNGWGGVMMRESLASGARKILFKTRITNPNVIVGYRQVANQAQVQLSQVAQTVRWMKIQRNGNTFSVFTSYNGTTWTLRHSRVITMGSTVLAGFFAERYPASSIPTATFTSVEVADYLKEEIEVPWTGEDLSNEPWGFSMFPNPATTEVRIVREGMVNPNTEVKILDAFGRTVQSLRMDEAELVVDVSQLSSGIYFVRINYPTGLLNRKLVIERPSEK